jgi:hypothetical protein
MVQVNIILGSSKITTNKTIIDCKISDTKSKKLAISMVKMQIKTISSERKTMGKKHTKKNNMEVTIFMM